jgi:hypothetical protein
VPALLLHDDLALAASAAAPEHVVRAVSGADPLRLDLPPVPGVQSSPEALRAMSALYLAARLEEAGVVQAAEFLVRERATLRVSVGLAAKLEEMARLEPHGYRPDQRLMLYARLFGIGPAAGASGAAGGSRFESQLAALCSALAEHARRTPYERPGAVARAGLDLAATAGSAGGGGVVLAVPRINDQLRRAIDVLSDPALGALLGVRGFWPTLQRMLEPNVPDLRRLLDCGRHGQRVLRWLADAVPVLERSGMAAPEAPPDVALSALAWLTATGLAAASQGEGSV